jgi:hypothetical protein
MTRALQRTKTALMKKLSAGSVEEYEEIEGDIARELKIVQTAQAELLALKKLERERGGRTKVWI